MTSSALTITTEQLFSRPAMAYLWNIKSKLDQGQVAHLDAMFKRKSKRSIQPKQTVTYKLSPKKPGQLGYGRLYGPKGSLEYLEREIRGTICRDFYYDLDIVNCHPVLLSQISHKNYEIDLPELDKYIANRDYYLSLLCDGERELAKTEIIKVLYNGKSEHLKELSKEVKLLAKRFALDQRYKELADACKDSDNFYGTFLSHVCCTEERKVMLCMKQTAEEEGWSVDALCYDGIMIRKDPNLTFTDQLLRKLETRIAVETGYIVQIKNKEFEFYEIEYYDEELVAGVKKSEYDEMKRKFELNNFYYHPSHSYLEIREGKIITHDTIQHAKDAYMKEWCFIVSDKFADTVQFFDLWRIDPTRKEIRTIDFKPSNDPSVYTLPFHFKYQNYDAPTDPTPYLQIFHTLLRINTNNNVVLQEYLLNYLAHLVQKPLESPRMALMFTGPQGAGKDTLFEFIGSWVLGSLYYKDYSSNDQFFEKHDTGKENKFMVKLQEADPVFCRKNSSNLKALITSPTLEFNPKGKPSYTLPNYTRFILTTNKGNPLELEQGDRRWVIFVASPEYIGNIDFFKNKIEKILCTPQGGKAIADYLLGINIQNFEPTVKPENPYQEAVLESEKPVEDRFLDFWDGKELLAGDLYLKYKEFCIENSLPYLQSSLALGKRLLTYIASGRLIKSHKRDGYYYSKK